MFEKNKNPKYLLNKKGEDIPIDNIKVLELKEKIKKRVDGKSDDKDRYQIGEPSNK